MYMCKNGILDVSYIELPSSAMQALHACAAMMHETIFQLLQFLHACMQGVINTIHEMLTTKNELECGRVMHEGVPSAIHYLFVLS